MELENPTKCSHCENDAIYKIERCYANALGVFESSHPPSYWCREHAESFCEPGEDLASLLSRTGAELMEKSEEYKFDYPPPDSALDLVGRADFYVAGTNGINPGQGTFLVLNGCYLVLKAIFKMLISIEAKL